MSFLSPRKFVVSLLGLLATQTAIAANTVRIDDKSFRAISAAESNDIRSLPAIADYSNGGCEFKKARLTQKEPFSPLEKMLDVTSMNF